HDGALRPRRQYDDPGRNQPTRPARTIDRGEAAIRSVAGRRCAARSWRSQPRFTAKGPTGAGPTPDMLTWVSSRLQSQSSPATLSRQLARLRHLGVFKRVLGA